MHGSLRDWLIAQKARLGVASHLGERAEFGDEFEMFREQAEFLRLLRAPEDMEPSPGFYSRVLQRIEARAKKSIWWIFAYSPAGKRLAYVSLATAIVLGSYVVAQESRDGSLYMGAVPVTERGVTKHHYDIPVAGDVEQQRAAVLANFASHSGTRP